MAQNSKHGLLSFTIDGEEVSAPLGWQDISVLATFDNEGTQANITISEVELTLDAADRVRKYIADGLNGGPGIFEGLPCELSVSNINAARSVFKGFINLADDVVDEKHNSRIYVKIEKEDGLNSLNDKLTGTTYGYLESIGLFTSNDYVDVNYVVEKKDAMFDIFVSSITLFLMVKELADSAYKTADALVDVAALIATGFTGPIAATIKTVGNAAVMVIYTAIMLVTVINLANDLFAMLISPLRTHKAATLKTLLSKVCAHFGYAFETDIPELDSYHFLPSNMYSDIFGANGFIQFTRGTKKGIPNTQDTGYRCSEMFGLVSELFNAKWAVISDVVQFRPVDSPYWMRNANYLIPDVLELPKGYNTKELDANRLLSFATDISDAWTVDNFKGTNFEVITDAIASTNSKSKRLSGLNTVKIPWALGNRKDSLSVLEQTLAALGGVIDELTGLFGGGTDFKNRVESRIGSLKVSSNISNSPKLLYLNQSSAMPMNHRSKLSARYIVENYHRSKSFIADGYRNQKEVYTNIRIPFGFSDFVSTIENSYCRDAKSRECKITKLEYNISSDTATVDYWVRQPYTTNLKESYIEPE